MHRRAALAGVGNFVLALGLVAPSAAMPSAAMQEPAQCVFVNEIDPYTMYNNLNGDAQARSSDECKSNCCADGSCDVWQWSDDPMTPPNCWSGNSQDYGDSGGVEWQGEQGKGSPGPAPVPPPGFAPCTRRPSVGDQLLINSADPNDQGTCVEAHLHQVGTLVALSGDSQPYQVAFPSCR